MRTIYDKLHLKQPIWLSLYKYEDGTFATTITIGGYSREGLSFNKYDKFLFLVIRGDRKQVLKLSNLLDKMKIRMPSDIQRADKK